MSEISIGFNFRLSAVIFILSHCRYLKCVLSSSMREVVAQMLYYCSEGCEFRSQDHKASTAGPLSKGTNPQLLSYIKMRWDALDNGVWQMCFGLLKSCQPGVWILMQGTVYGKRNIQYMCYGGWGNSNKKSFPEIQDISLSCTVSKKWNENQTSSWKSSEFKNYVKKEKTNREK